MKSDTITTQNLYAWFCAACFFFFLSVSSKWLKIAVCWMQFDSGRYCVQCVLNYILTIVRLFETMCLCLHPPLLFLAILPWAFSSHSECLFNCQSSTVCCWWHNWYKTFLKNQSIWCVCSCQSEGIFFVWSSAVSCSFDKKAVMINRKNNRSVTVTSAYDKHRASKISRRTARQEIFQLVDPPLRLTSPA